MVSGSDTGHDYNVASSSYWVQNTSLKLKPAEQCTESIIYADLNSDSISEVIITGKGNPLLFYSCKE